jgi:NhaP-type Na+/H+ or K+/H+ antiporter
MGLFASFAVWTIFGALLLAPVLEGGLQLMPIMYAVLSLTVVRMIPVGLSMIGSRLRGPSILFMGWFGPRGLASVVFTLIAFETLGHEETVTTTLVEIATWTVFLSVMAHGLSARRLSRKYGSLVAHEPVEHHHVSAHHEDPVPRSLSHSSGQAIRRGDEAANSRPGS